MEMWSHPEQIMHWLLVLTSAIFIPAACRAIGSAFGYTFAVQLWRTYLFKHHRVPAAIIIAFTIAFEVACVIVSVFAVSKALAGANITDSTVLMVSHLLNLALHICLTRRYAKEPSVHSNGRTYKRKSANSAT